MQNGNWTPISKTAVSLLPKNRAYTDLEALYCLQVDYNNNTPGSINGYARLWGWPYRQVINLFDTLDLCLEYPKDTHKKQNQSGVLSEKKTEKISGKITERSVKDNRKIKFIFNNDLQGQTERSVKDNRKITERSALNDYKTSKTEDLKEESKALAGDDETSPPPPPVKVKKPKPPKVKKPKPPKEKKPISADHPLFIAWWCHVFEQTQGDTYIVGGAKDGATVKIILEGCKEGIHEAMGRACFFLVEDDPFWRGKHTIALFWSQINKCRPSLSQMDKYRRMGLCPPAGEDVAGWVNAVVAGAMHQAEGVLC